MRRMLLLGLLFIGSGWGQSSLDILNTPTDARAASLGVNQSPMLKPSRILSHPDRRVNLSLWNWIADIQGGTIGIGLEKVYLSFQAFSSGDLEYRDETPSVDPVSTFSYTLFNTGAAYAREIGPLRGGVALSYLYERTLNASASGLSFSLSGAYTVSDRLILSGGLRNMGFTQTLDEESTTLPSEAWVELDLSLAGFDFISELNSGSIPVSMGLGYPILDRFEILGSIQLEPADPDLRIHTSFGFTADWDNFILGYSLYQFDHSLGPRHFISLYWKY